MGEKFGEIGEIGEFGKITSHSPIKTHQIAHNQEISTHHPVNHRHSPNVSLPKLLDDQFITLFPHQTFLLYVTGPTKIDHVSTNYTKLYFRSYLSFRMHYPISVSCRRKPIKFCNSDKDFVAVVLTVIKL